MTSKPPLVITTQPVRKQPVYQPRYSNHFAHATKDQLLAPLYMYGPGEEDALIDRFTDLAEKWTEWGFEYDVLVENVGYWGGYHPRDNRLFTYRTLNIEHPVFGMDEPTAEEAFKKGQEMARTLKPIAENQGGEDVDLEAYQRKISAAGLMKSAIKKFLDEWNNGAENNPNLGKHVQAMQDAMESYLNADVK